MTRYLVIENDIVTNIVIGEIENSILATGNLENANIGDVIKNGKIIPREDERNYAEKRRAEYGSVEFQNDLKYWDLVEGTNSWQEHIETIKAKYPKPVYTGWWHTNSGDMANDQGSWTISDVVGDSSNTSYPVGSSTSIARFTLNAVSGETESSFILTLNEPKPIDSISFELDNTTNTGTPTIAWYSIDEDGNETLLRKLTCIDGESYSLTNHKHVNSAKYKIEATNLSVGKPIRLINGVITVCQKDFDKNPFS